MALTAGGVDGPSRHATKVVDRFDAILAMRSQARMPPRTAPRRREPSWSERGSAAVDLGDLEVARACFAQAVRTQRGEPKHRYHLAVVQEGLGELAAAGASLTEALRLDPTMADAARRLSLLAGRCDLPGDAPLDPAGLKAALAHDTVD